MACSSWTPWRSAPTQGHYVALDMPRAPYPLGGAGESVVEDVRRLGGFGIAAHPDSPKPSLRWTSTARPDGARMAESRQRVARRNAMESAARGRCVPGPARTWADEILRSSDDAGCAMAGAARDGAGGRGWPRQTRTAAWAGVKRIQAGALRVASGFRATRRVSVRSATESSWTSRSRGKPLSMRVPFSPQSGREACSPRSMPWLGRRYSTSPSRPASPCRDGRGAA